MRIGVCKMKAGPIKVEIIEGQFYKTCVWKNRCGDEVLVAVDLALHPKRMERPPFVACPSCGRRVEYIQEASA